MEILRNFINQSEPLLHSDIQQFSWREIVKRYWKTSHSQAEKNGQIHFPPNLFDWPWGTGGDDKGQICIFL